MIADTAIEANEIAKSFLTRKVKKILVGAPHRTPTDGNCTNLGEL